MIQKENNSYFLWTLSTEKKPLAMKLPFLDESQALKWKLIKQSGGDGGGEWKTKQDV